MASDTVSSVDEQQAQLVAATSTDNRGRHRVLAELNRLEQELKFLQGFIHRQHKAFFCTLYMEELGELEQTENVSTICSELLPYTEGRPDPLLPLTNGPINLIWDRWFEGPQNSQSCSCLIL
ncbi:hypothetical protein ABKV19_018315 [Rosa sericea]